MQFLALSSNFSFQFRHRFTLLPQSRFEFIHFALHFLRRTLYASFWRRPGVRSRPQQILQLCVAIVQVCQL
jgi:hypothetical protein